MRRKRFRAILRSTDVSTATAVPIYLERDNSAYTLLAGEFVEIWHYSVVASAPDSDVHLFCGLDSTSGNGETVFRGNFTNSLDLAGAVTHLPVPWVGEALNTLWVKTTGAVTVDVVVVGTIREAAV